MAKPMPCPTKHRHVELMSASIEKRTRASSFLIETAVCRDCGDTVRRETIVRPPNEWRTAREHSEAPASPLYLCVAGPAARA